MSTRSTTFGVVLAGLVVLACASPTFAQKALLDELVVLSAHGTERGAAVTPTRKLLGTSPAPSIKHFYKGQVPVKERLRLTTGEIPLPKGELPHLERAIDQRHAGPGGRRHPVGGSDLLLARAQAPTGGSLLGGGAQLLMVPEAAEDPGPANGITLGQAIEHLLAHSLELQSKSYEIPTAEADAYQAGRPLNPYVFYASEGIPYGEYRPGKPGEIAHTITLLQAFSVTGKYTKQEQAGLQAVRVIKAQYDDAVRKEIDHLHMRWVEVLEARETHRFAEAAVERLKKTLDEAQKQNPPKRTDLLKIEHELASLAAEQLKTRLKVARAKLAEVLYLPPDAADTLSVSGKLDEKVPLPPTEELVALALQHRPDVAALREHVVLALKDVQVARANRIPDLYAIWTPFTYRHFPLPHERDSVAMGFGLFSPIPILNRNLGNIRHAQLNVGRIQTELSAVERRVLTEVQTTSEEILSGRKDLEKLEQEILPLVRKQLEQAEKRYLAGEISDDQYVTLLRKFEVAAIEYRNVLVKHRFAQLRLNSVVGCRVVP